MTTQQQPMIASVDLGSNSFRLQICQIDNGQLKAIDALKVMVRLAAGLDEQKNLDEASQARALDCLAKFGERLRGFESDQVRAVATNTFRGAKNIREFLPQAEAALGFPIEIIAGREEARLIYTGVVHTLPTNGDKMLVVDIGGGSTEFVIGSELVPIHTESLPLGCVTYSLRFFSGKITQKDFQTAIYAARAEIQRISKMLKREGWQLAVGTSGSAKAIRDLITEELGGEESITYAGMQHLMQRICEAGSVRKARFNDLKPERIDVFAGGLAVMMAVFEELDVKTMTVTDAALRDGVFYDLIGRQLHDDMRDQTVALFQKRYHVAASQANRVADTAGKLLANLCSHLPAQEAAYWQQYVRWTAQLHEIGLNIAHTAYHKHTAYVLEHADMPGFSRKEQQILSTLALGQRGDLRKMPDLVGNHPMMWVTILALRLAVLLCRARLPLDLPPSTLLNHQAGSRLFTLHIAQNWLNDNPLTADTLQFETDQWRKINIDFTVHPH